MLKILALSLLMSSSVFAQNMQWGTGMAMGAQQNCGYQQRTGSGAVSMSDEVNEILEAMKEEKNKLQSAQRKQKTLTRELDRMRSDIENSLEPDESSFAFNHMENNRRCEEYDENPVGEVVKYCEAGKAGGVSTSICRGDQSRACQKALPEYRKKYAESQKLGDEIDTAQRNIERLKDEAVDARAQAREDRESGTEAGVCLECMASGSGYVTQQNSPNWAGVAANVGTGLAAMYMGYKTNQMVAEYNSDLGWPTMANNSVASVGYPYLAAGVYGALGGGTGQGAFGCGSTGGAYGNMNGGAFGYPTSMYGSPMGGGMYNTMGMGTTDYSTMQYQTQMYQSYLQQQQSQMQNYMTRYQTMSSLQTELSSLMYRIQQVQSGAYTTTGTGYLTTGTTYVPGAIPAPSTGTTMGTTTLYGR
ncbi:hypothetical protein [Bdellovibrio sp. HCB337]|uniref:hypothetical protein n=1 Tax=Bdellovibrio sp. HCB337 TaxID=3394358 RepID=UPI0039A5AF2F